MKEEANRWCRMMLVGAIVLTPVWAFAEGSRSERSGDPMSNQSMNQPKSTYEKQATDMSPDVSYYMDEINKVRNQPEPQGGDPNAGGTDRPASAGPMGETSVGGQGPSGTRALPPGQAPGYEGDAAGKTSTD